MLTTTSDTQGQPPTQSADEILLDKPGIARRLNKSLRTVDDWMKRGRLPYIKVGRSVLFRWGRSARKVRTVSDQLIPCAHENAKRRTPINRARGLLASGVCRVMRAPSELGL
jgi:excisionase family DNA binding protein